MKPWNYQPSLVRYAIILAVLVTSTGFARERVSLDGTWRLLVEEQPDSTTISSVRQQPFLRTIEVPGAWETQGVGEAGEKINVRRSFMGRCWYRKRFQLDPGWRGKRVFLSVGGTHRIATWYLNGEKLGTHTGFATPYEYEITDTVVPGGENVLHAVIDNREQPNNTMRGCLNFAHPFGGFHGSVHLEARAPSHILTYHLRTRVAEKQLLVDLKADARESGTWSVELTAEGIGFASRFSRSFRFADPSGVLEQGFQCAIPVDHLWTPETPNLYQLRLTLKRDGQEVDTVSQRYGLRTLTDQEGQLFLNGKRYFLRGYGDDNLVPVTGIPPLTKERYVEQFRRAKSFGFNHARYHSWTPNAASFAAADEVGMLLQPELQIAYKPYRDNNVDVLKEEWERIVLAKRNHTSLFAISMGNELGDGHENPLQQALYPIGKALAPDTFILDNTGYGNDNPARKTDIFTKGQGRRLFRRPKWLGIPSIAHEMGNFNALEDFSLIPKYTGLIEPVGLKAEKNKVREAGLMKHYDHWLTLSRRQQRDSWKWMMENARMLPWLDGYQFWLITDYDRVSRREGQANIGLLDSFWDPKPHADPRDIRRFNGESVLLIPHTDKTLLARGGDLHEIPVGFSHFGDPIDNPALSYRLTLPDKTGEPQTIDLEAIDKRGLMELTTLELSLPDVDEKTKATLSLVLSGQEGMQSTNSWPLWIFPAPDRYRDTTFSFYDHGAKALTKIFPNATFGGRNDTKVHVYHGLSEAVIDALTRGENAVVIARTGSFNAAPTQFLPGWWTRRNNLGTHIARHPLFTEQEQDSYCQWPFRELMNQSAGKLDLRQEAPNLTPLIWSLPEKKGLVYEMQVGRGRLLLTSFPLLTLAAQNNVQAIDLLDRMVSYLQGDTFSGAVRVDAEALPTRLSPPPGPYLSGWTKTLGKGKVSAVWNRQGKTDIRWQTGVVDSEGFGADSVVFRFSAQATVPNEKSEYTVYANQKELITFTPALSDFVGEGADGSQLVFILDNVVSSRGGKQTAVGDVFLTVPKAHLRPGEPVTLGVKAGNQTPGSFSIFPEKR